LGARLRRLCLKWLVLLKSKGIKMKMNKPKTKDSYGMGMKAEQMPKMPKAKKAMPMRGERTAKNKAKKIKY